jgi:hypothetical protein
MFASEGPVSGLIALLDEHFQLLADANGSIRTRFGFIEDTTILRTRFSTAKFWSFSKVLPVKVEYISAGVAGYAQLWTDA